MYPGVRSNRIGSDCSIVVVLPRYRRDMFPKRVTIVDIPKMRYKGVLFHKQSCVHDTQKYSPRYGRDDNVSPKGHYGQYHKNTLSRGLSHEQSCVHGSVFKQLDNAQQLAREICKRGKSVI